VTVSGSHVADVGDSAVAAYVPRLLAGWLRDQPDERWRSIDATLVFVDVSGFTALSERLARAGNIGAEELTDTIAACFAALLEVAYRAGGSLLKFGGDALLLLFTDDGHPERGARAAIGMRAALRRMGRIETSAGPVTLRMSIGLHSGQVHLFCVGGSHRELVVTGPGATQTVQMEGAAAAGQIIVSPSAAQRLPASLVGEPSGPGFLLAVPRGAEVADVAAALPQDRRASWTAIPVALRAHLGSGERDAEHRLVTVAFLRFSGVDQLIERDGADAMAAALDAMIHAAQQGADQHGITFLGSDVDASGGKVILAAGAPTSGGNDEERMLLAVRDIVEQPNPVPFQIGLHAGHVFAGDLGPAYRRAYTVMGDAVNLAARVMGRARPGQILATNEVLQASRTTFETTELEPFRVKGKRAPVVAYDVGPVLGSRPGHAEGERSELPFVGREHELATFDRIVAAAATDGGQLVEVVGEAGIGKSRLVAAFHDRSHQLQRHHLTCELHRASSPYGSTRKLLRPLLGTPTDAPPSQAADELVAFLGDRLPELEEWAPLLAIAIGSELPPTPATASLDQRFLRPRLHELVLELLSELWEGPTLVTIEDAQWMDEASADVLRALCQRLHERPWIVCVTRRELDATFAEDAPSTTLELAPLDASETTQLVSAATDAVPLAAHDMAQLVERSAGNPLFLQELVVAAQAVGGVDSLPGSIESLMTARVDRLPPDLRDLLREVSVLGYSFPRDLASAVVTRGRPGRLRRLSDLLSEEGDLIRFRHALLRDAAYEGLAFRRRRDLHALAAETIAAAGDDRPELLSFHYHLAARYERSWQTSVVAGRRAASVYANTEAARFYRRALDAARRVPGLDPLKVARVAEALGDALQRMGELEEASTAYRAASRAVRDDPVAWAGVVLKDAQVKAQLAWYPPALAAITRARRRLADLDAPEAQAQRAKLSVWYGQLRLRQGRFDDAIEWCRTAMEEAEACGEREALAHAYRLVDAANAERGQLRGTGYSERGLELYEELGDLPNQAAILNNLGAFGYWAGNWTEALDYYQRANDIEDRVGNVIGAALGRSNVAEILADQGRWQEADRYFREAERALRAARFLNGMAFVRANIGRTAARAGRFEEAEELLVEARQGAQEVGAATQVVEADLRLAELEVLRGRPDAALSFLDDALDRQGASEGVVAQGPMLHRVRGYALLQKGESEAAEAALRDSLEAARARDAEYERALAEWALSDLHELVHGVPDEALLASSRSTFDALGVERLPDIPRRPVDVGV
jgi:class 3 adenylate cyclase/tetratricopeptide (TPR) repeat protein